MGHKTKDIINMIDHTVLLKKENLIKSVHLLLTKIINNTIISGEGVDLDPLTQEIVLQIRDSNKGQTLIIRDSMIRILH